jgi:hypothetical protein
METIREFLAIVWRAITRIASWVFGLLRLFFLFFRLKRWYVLGSRQALEQVRTEFRLLKSAIMARPLPGIKQEEKDAIELIESLFPAASDQLDDDDYWARIGEIELAMITLMDLNALVSYSVKLKNNIYVLHESDRPEWTKRLDEFLKDPKAMDLEAARALVHALTAEISRSRQEEYLTTCLKGALLTRFLIITIILGLAVATMFYAVLHDILVFYALVLGTLGGFFSRVLALKDLDYKAPAFRVMSQYNYVQASLGGISALVLYILLISPVGAKVLNNEVFYLDSTTVSFWTEPMAFGPWKISLVDSATMVRVQRSVKHPLPSAFILLAFLAGFSERWLLGTLENIVGKKLQKPDVPPPAAPTTGQQGQKT